jgi:4-amino-4-deoxy-L-arabinose transferase-like glycosyltransferase
MRNRFKISLIVLAALGVYLAGNGRVSLWDRDEPRYAQTSRQMLQSGDWVVPRLLDLVRNAKPIFIYWCQASAMKVFGDNEFAARLPSSLAMVLTLMVMGGVVYRMIGARRAMWTTFILATTVLTMAAAKMCLTDAVLLLFVTIAQICLVLIYVDGRKKAGNFRGGETNRILPGPKGPGFGPGFVLWVGVGLGGLTKGPVVLGILLATMLVLAVLDVGEEWKSTAAWKRAIAWWPKTHPLRGLFIIALICGPWLILIHDREPKFLSSAIYHDVYQRATSGLEGHKAPPGYYTVLVWGMFFPWSILLPAMAVRCWKRRRLPAVRFALAATVGPWIMFEILATKLPFYVLPAFPMLAFLAADTVVGMQRKGSSLPRISTGLGIAMACLVVVAYEFVLPQVAWLRVSQRVADILHANNASHAIMIDYKEDSLPWCEGGTIRGQRENDYLIHTSPSDWPKWVVLTGEIWHQTPRAIQQQFDVIGNPVHGLAYADHLRTVDVYVLRKR